MYCKGGGLTLKKKTRNALANIQGNLGHPSCEGLARMLINDGASQEFAA